jgi:HNH endonuclease
MKNYWQIELTKGKITQVSEEDWAHLGKHKWCAFRGTGCSTYYAGRSQRLPGGGTRWITMHRLILNAPDHMVVDHVNGDTLDNRRGQIRLATVSQNVRNSRISVRNTSGYKGASRNPSGGWWAHIRINGKTKYLGTFPTPQQAHEKYCAESKRLFGEFARAS